MDGNSENRMAELHPNANTVDPLTDLEHWTKEQVKQWALSLEGVDAESADKLFEQNITGPSLQLINVEDLKAIGVTLGPAKVIIHARDEIDKLKQERPRNAGKTCKPYPFGRCHNSYRYVEGDLLNPESGTSNFIEPCHEYKAFTNTTEETKMAKFTFEVIRFAAACMNSRTNGTIHFGVGDKPHGQIIGVDVGEKRDEFDKKLRHAIDQHFEFKHRDTAQKCIKPPRFVGVLNTNMTTSEKLVIEVDIVPHSSLCRESVYHTTGLYKDISESKETPKTEKQFFVREGESTNNLLAKNKAAKLKYDKFISDVPQLSKLRMESEEDYLKEVKRHQQGSKLCEMITGGSGSLDKSFYEHYIVVANKSHPIQLDSVDFLVELNPIAVLDFDPQSIKNGLCKSFEEKSPVNVHSPDKYKLTESVTDIANKLHLTRTTSWVFCNGGIGDEQPSEVNRWLMDKGASVRNNISYLCRKDVLRSKRLLVVFLLLSDINDKMDPLVETFSTFYQELQGIEQILCICDNENSYTSWKNLLDARCGVDISNRCIYELSFPEVNGTILGLLSKNRRSIRLLPGGGGSRVALKTKLDRQLTTLDVLCVNQCEGGNEDQLIIEQHFYRGGQVSWWNFYFSEQPGSMSFIKRDKFDYIVETLIPDLCSLRKACVRLNLFHVPGCGGTTLAKHILWTLKEKFRCAVLIDNNADHDTVAEHVVTLLEHGCKEKETPLPVVLMIDDFEDMEKVFDLQERIEKQCSKSNIQSGSPLVILLNCMRSEYNSEKVESTEDSVFIGNNLTDDEQKQFDHKRKEMDKNYTPAEIETFYGFMLMKKNFSSEYFESVVKHTLKSFDMKQKHGQLMAVLVLMSVYCKHAALSVSLCEEYLGLRPKPHCGDIQVEDGFQQFSTLLRSCDVRAEVVFQGVGMIHSQMAKYCLNELNSNHKFSKAEITNFLLTTDELYGCTQGKDKLIKDVYYILVKRFVLDQESLPQTRLLATSTQHKHGDSQTPVASRFSPLIRDIEHETPGLEESVLLHASNRFQKNAIIAQLVARYYYLKRKDFHQAKRWAKTSKELLPHSSYISDTSAQVLKHELKFGIAKANQHDAETLKRLLKLAKSALDAFKETKQLAKNESMQRLQYKWDHSPLNITGFLGEIQVCVHIIEVLEKIPIFSTGKIRHDILSSMLSGDIHLEQMEIKDPEYRNYIPFYRVLQEFSGMLYHLKDMMKSNFVFLDKYNVNLGSKFGMKGSRDQTVQSDIYQCFKKFAQIFCQTESRLPNTNKLKLHKARQLIEMEKVDTYSGILNCLSKNIKPEVLREILNAYKLVQNARDCSTVEKINYIYVNIVLRCIDLKLIEEPFPRLITLLCTCLKHPAPDIYLPLYFMAVVLLWPQTQFSRAESGHLQGYITHLRTAYHTEMKHVYNGKRAIVHFFLGKNPGYEHIVHLGEIKTCINASDEQFASQWENGTIWRNAKVKALLGRVNGEVKSQNILADTCDRNIKVEVSPLFKSQLRRYKEGSTVSFLIGFSMQGPFAIDIY